MHEKRLIGRLTKYWDDLRKDDPMPDIVRFSIEALPDIQARLLVLKLISASGAISYRYEYVGQDVVKSYGRDITGEMVNVNMHDFPGAKIMKRIGELSENPRIISDEGQFFAKGNNSVIRYRACLLPFGNDKNSVTHIVAGLSWREF